MANTLLLTANGHLYVTEWWEEAGTWRAKWKRCLPGADDKPVHDSALHLAAVAGNAE